MKISFKQSYLRFEWSTNLIIVLAHLKTANTFTTNLK